MQFTAETIASFLGGDIIGDKNVSVRTVAKIEEGTPGALSFLANPKYEHYIYNTESTIVIVDRTFKPRQQVNATLIAVDDAYGCFAKLLELYAASKPVRRGISGKASIDDSAVIGENCYVGDFAVVEAGVRIGDGTRIYPQVFIGERVRVGRNAVLYPGVRIYEDCVLGDNVIIHAGTVVGADGFGFAPDSDGNFAKIPQVGNVIIEDDVEIGANSCIDRATMGSTVIGRGVKLDNLIQIGHNVTVGPGTVAAAQVGISGSTKVGSHCMLGGQVGIAGHLKIGDRVQIGSKSGVPNSIPDGTTMMGNPAMQAGKFHRSNAIYRHLPELSAQVFRLEKEFGQLLEKIQ